MGTCPFIYSCAHVHVVLSHLSPVRLFETPRTIAHQAPLSMEFSRQEYRSGLPCLPPGDLPDSGIKLASLMPPALAGGFFTTDPPGKPIYSYGSQPNCKFVWKPLYYIVLRSAYRSPSVRWLINETESEWPVNSSSLDYNQSPTHFYELPCAQTNHWYKEIISPSPSNRQAHKTSQI